MQIDSIVTNSRNESMDWCIGSIGITLNHNSVSLLWENRMWYIRLNIENKKNPVKNIDPFWMY